MKAITLIQPWATAMRAGLKCAETRSWGTAYRGLLAIHGGKKIDGDQLVHLPRDLRDRMPVGAVLGVVELYSVERMDEERVRIMAETTTECLDDEAIWGNWQVGRFAWWTRPVVWFREPIAARGSLGLWEWQEPANWRELG